MTKTKNKRKQNKTKKRKNKQKGGMRSRKLSFAKIPSANIPSGFFENLKTEFRMIERTGVTIEIDRENSMVTININDRNSFLFYVNNKILRIIQVIKRSPIEISRFIKIIIEVFMRTDFFTRLELGDTSKIEFNFDKKIEISLFKMKILETSHTWYENLGFKNDSLESKREGIVAFINKKLIDEIDEIKLTDYIDEIDINNILIKDFMVFVKNKLKSEISKETAMHIKDIVDNLYYNLTQKVGTIDLGTNYINK